jgi:magnesium chelatase subunit I
VREVIEEVAFQARADRRIDKRSGVSQRLPITVIENVASNAERRSLVSGDEPPVARLSDVYAALPSITGKFELEYEGELRGADVIARELIRSAVANVFLASLDGLDTARTVDWFDGGGTLPMEDMLPSAELLSRVSRVPGLLESTRFFGVGDDEPAPLRASAVEFILEGLAATKRISRSDERGYQAAEPSANQKRSARREEPSMDEMPPMPGGRKKYYN